MADNLKQLQENVDTVIPLNGGVASVKVVNHNPHTKEIIEKAGRLTGFPFKAGRTPTNNSVPVGTFFWNGNAMNKITPFDITVNNNTMDGNYLDRILALCTEGTIIHFKDFVGRSTTLKFISYSKAKEVLTITVVGFSENTNYAYQVGEEELCMLEFVGVSGNNNIFSNPLDNVEIGLFWGNKQKELEVKKIIYHDLQNTGLYFQKTFQMIALLLGIEVKNFESIKDYKPRILITRYKKRKQVKKSPSSGSEMLNAKYREQEQEQQISFFNPINQSIEYAERPKRIALNSEKQFYDIFAENYYDLNNVPLPKTNKNFVTKTNKDNSVDVWDDTNKISSVVDKKQKGFVHLYLRLEIEYNNQILVSKPLLFFKIINELHWLYFDGNENIFRSRIRYSYE